MSNFKKRLSLILVCLLLFLYSCDVNVPHETSEESITEISYTSKEISLSESASPSSEEVTEETTEEESDVSVPTISEEPSAEEPSSEEISDTSDEVSEESSEESSEEPSEEPSEETSEESSEESSEQSYEPGVYEVPYVDGIHVKYYDDALKPGKKYPEKVNRKYIHSEENTLEIHGIVDVTSKDCITYIKHIIDNFGHDLSIVLYKLDGSLSMTYNSDAAYFSACTIKAPYILVLCQYLDSINYDENTLIEYKEKHYKEGTGYIQYSEFGTKYTVKYLIEQALNVSDNSAYYMLIDTFGNDRYNAYMEKLGCHSLTKWGMFAALAKPEDYVIAWYEIYKYFQTNTKYSKIMKDACTNSPYAYACAQVSAWDTSHKSGDNLDPEKPVCCDACIVWKDTPYILVLFSRTMRIENNTYNTLLTIADLIHYTITEKRIYLAEDGWVDSGGSGLRLRYYPGSADGHLILEDGDKVNVLTVNEDWAYVQYGSLYGYVKSKYVVDADGHSMLYKYSFKPQEEPEKPPVDVSEEPSSEEPSVESSEESSTEVSEEPSIEVSEEPSIEVSEEPSIEVSEETSEEVSEEPSIEVSEEPSEEVSEEPSIEVSEEPSEEASEEPSEEASEEISFEVSEESSDTPEETTEEVSAVPEEPSSEESAQNE